MSATAARVSLGLLVLVLRAGAQASQVASVSASVETAPVPTNGDAADDIAIWVHPTQPGLSLVIGTDKRAGIAVYDLRGRQHQFLAAGEVNNIDLRQGFPLLGSEVTLVAGTERINEVLLLYVLDPDRLRLYPVNARDIPVIGDYGCGMYRSPRTGEFYVFCTAPSGVVQQWRLFPASARTVDAELVRTFDAGGQTEGLAADDESGFLFVAEEERGIWLYGAEPSAGHARVLIDAVDAGRLHADVEGLALYHGRSRSGYLIASSQGNDTFVLYERRPPFAHVLTFEIDVNPALHIDAVGSTDGIDVTNLALGPSFPAGVFIAQDGNNPGHNQNFKLVPWQVIAEAANPPLLIDESFDPRGALCDLAGWRSRNGSGVNPTLLASIGRPVMGTSWECALDCTASAGGHAVLFAYPRPSHGLFLPAGEVLVDLASGRLFTRFAPQAGNVVHFPLPLPNELLLCGVTASMQGACLGPGAAVLSNALDVRIGR